MILPDGATYLARLSDPLIERALEKRRVVLIEGPRHCGKTWSASRYCKNRFDLEKRPIALSEKIQAAEPIEIPPVEGAALGLPQESTPVLLQGWEGDSAKWDAIVGSLSMRDDKGCFILTSSEDFSRDSSFRTAASQVAHVRMGVMSLLESGVSDGAVSLASLFDDPNGLDCGVDSALNDVSLAELMVRGGWPETVGAPLEEATGYIKSIAGELVADISGACGGYSGIPVPKVTAFAAACSRNIGIPVTNLAICKEVDPQITDEQEKLLVSCQAQMIKRYMFSDTENWLATKALEQRFSYLPRRYFADPSLAVAYLGTDIGGLISDRVLFNHLFQNMVIRDVEVYSRAVGARALRYDDKDGNSIDVVIIRGGEWCGLMTQLDDADAEQSARKLLKTATHLADYGAAPARSLAVIVGSNGRGCTLDNGVKVIPIDRLGI